MSESYQAPSITEQPPASPEMTAGLGRAAVRLRLDLIEGLNTPHASGHMFDGAAMFEGPLWESDHISISGLSYRRVEIVHRTYNIDHGNHWIVTRDNYILKHEDGAFVRETFGIKKHSVFDDWIVKNKSRGDRQELEHIPAASCVDLTAALIKRLDAMKAPRPSFMKRLDTRLGKLLGPPS